MATNSIKLLTGNSHPDLAKMVADRLGIELTKIMVLQYSNQETSVTIGESVRDEDGMPLPKTLQSKECINCLKSSYCNPPPQAISTTDSWNS